MSNLLLTVGGAALLINGGLATIPTTYEGTVTMNVTRSTQEVAPETVMWDVSGYSGFDTSAPSGTFDERWHDFVFLWDFGDTGKTYTLPTRLPTAHKNANIAYGPAVAHTYTAAGTYNASCLVIEPSSGKQALYEYTVVVADPDTVFAGARTITVGPSGRDFTTLQAAMESLSGVDDIHRIVLDRDQTYDLSAGRSQRYRAYRNMYVTASTSGTAKPIIDVSGATVDNIFDYMDQMNYAFFGDSTNIVDWVWSDIRFEGDWDTALESGTAPVVFQSQRGQTQTATYSTPRYVMFHNCESDGVDKFYYAGGAGKFVGFSDCHITNWRDYGFLGGADRIAFLGTKIEQKVTALSGGAKDGVHNNHGPIRINALVTVMDGCELFSNTGWFLNVGGYNTQQPCVRIAFVGREGDACNFQRSIMEGGYDVLNITFQNNNTEQSNMNMLVEKCYLLGTHMTNRIVTILYGGVTLRNNIMVRPNTPVINSTFGLAGFISIDVTSLSTGNELERILIEHNQYINLQSTANGGTTKAGATVRDNTGAGAFPSNLVERHNVLHEPNLTSPNVPNAPLTTTAIFSPLCDAYRQRRELFTGDFGTDTASDWNYGDTQVINYSAGNINDSPNASSWQSGGAHTFTEEPLSGSEWTSVGGPDNNFSLSFGATSFTITNLAGKDEYFGGELSTWANGTTRDFPYSGGYFNTANGGSDLGDDTKYVGAAGSNSFLTDTGSSGTFVAASVTFEFFTTYVRVTNNSGGNLGGNNKFYKMYLERKAANYVPRTNGRGFRIELERNSTDFPAALTAYATPAGTAALYRQEVTSAAIDPGSPGAAYDDYFGTVRTGVKDLGAFEGTG